MSDPEHVISVFQHDQEIKKALIETAKDHTWSLCLQKALNGLVFNLSGNILTVSFIHPHFAQFYRQKWQAEVEKLVLAAFEGRVSVAYLTDNKIQEKLDLIPEPEDPFAVFLSNHKNDPALKAARNFCAAAPGIGTPRLVLCGQSGTGKTCLLSAIYKALIRLFGKNAVYMGSAGQFETRLDPAGFWRRHRAMIIDDCHSPGSTAITAYLDEAGKEHDYGPRRVAIAFTGFPNELDLLDSRLASRLRAGLVLELFPADLAMRIAYIEKNALSVALGRRQILTFARFARDIPSLAGLLQKLEFYGKMTGQSLSPEQLARMAMPDAQPTDWQRIVEQVAEKTQVKPAQILGSGRKRDVAQARMAAMYLCRKRLGLSYPELGRLFGGRDHATVMYGIKKILELRQVDRVVHTLLTELENIG